MNKMYSVNTYFAAQVISTILFQLFYPFTVSVIAFWFIGYQVTVKNFFIFFINSFIIEITGCAFGFFLGAIFTNDLLARTSLNIIVLFFLLISGGLASLARSSVIIRGISYLGPYRYGTEVLFRLISDGNMPPGKTQEAVMKAYGLQIGTIGCEFCLVAYIVISLILGWMILKYKNRNV